MLNHPIAILLVLALALTGCRPKAKEPAPPKPICLWVLDKAQLQEGLDPVVEAILPNVTQTLRGDIVLTRLLVMGQNLRDPQPVRLAEFAPRTSQDLRGLHGNARRAAEDQEVKAASSAALQGLKEALATRGPDAKLTSSPILYNLACAVAELKALARRQNLAEHLAPETPRKLILNLVSDGAEVSPHGNLEMQPSPQSLKAILKASTPLADAVEGLQVEWYFPARIGSGKGPRHRAQEVSPAIRALWKAVFRKGFLAKSGG